MSFIGCSIRQVFLQRGAVAKHDGTLPQLTEEICSVLIMIAVMPFLLLGVVGGDFCLDWCSERNGMGWSFCADSCSWSNDLVCCFDYE